MDVLGFGCFGLLRLAGLGGIYLRFIAGSGRGRGLYVGFMGRDISGDGDGAV